MNDQLLQREERMQLEKISNHGSRELWRRCAKILLLYDEGHPTREVAQAVGLSRSRVRYWRREFNEKGLHMFPQEDGASEFKPLATQEQAPVTGQEKAGEPDQGENPEVPPEEAKGSSGETPLAVESAKPAPQPALEEESRQKPSFKEFMTSVKDIQSPGLEPGDPLAEAGRKILRYHFAQMLRHEKGTRLGEDIEELHDMRVATRRMRAAVEVFGEAFQSKTLKPLLKGLKTAGKTLGHVRDLDVFLEKAHSYLEGKDQQFKQGLEPLIQTWQTKREAAREKMIAYLDSPQYESFKEEFFNFVSTPGAGAQPEPQDIFVPYLVQEITPVLIYSRYSSVRSFERVFANASIEQLHALRIEFKKLRYTVEFFKEVLGEEGKLVIEDIKSLQDHLGDLNDAQVATEILREFLGQWDLQQAALPVDARHSPKAIMQYLSDKYSERHHLMVTFREAWEYFDRAEFRRNLAQAVSVL
jgi:CHAD domain-containing protein